MENREFLESLLRVVNSSLDHVKEKWEDKSESEAYMVGYYQGTLNQVSSVLEFMLRDKNIASPPAEVRDPE